MPTNYEVEYSKKVPLSLEYVVFLVFGIFVSFTTSIACITGYPVYSNVLLITVVPVVTLAYSLFASFLMTEREILVSPIQMVCSSLTAVAAYSIQYYRYSPLAQYSQEVYSLLFFYMMWIAGSILFQNVIRFIIGTYGNREALDRYIQSFQSDKGLKEIRYELKQEWLSLLSGLKVTEDKSNDAEIRMRFRKFGTNLHIGFYGISKDKHTLIHIIPYCIHESMRRRDMLLSDDVATFMRPQIDQISCKLSLKETSDEQAILLAKQALFDSTNFFLQPMRFPLENTRKEIGIVFFFTVILMFLGLLRVTGTITDPIFAGFSGTSVAIMLAVLGWLRTRR